MQLFKKNIQKNFKKKNKNFNIKVYDDYKLTRFTTNHLSEKRS